MLSNFDDMVKQQVEQALIEDIGTGDITAALITTSPQARATLKTRVAGVLCGRAWLDAVYQQLSADIRVVWSKDDGQQLVAGEIFCEITGPAVPILTGERTAMNFLQLLSGIATRTSQFADRLSATTTQLLDTRKTIPGLRLAGKYAVRCGGGNNHRIGLFDAYLIKENHIAALGGFAPMLESIKSRDQQFACEVEVESLDQLKQVLPHQIEWVMLDNFSVDSLKEAIVLREHYRQTSAFYTKLEVSGNMRLDTIGDYALPGVDAISVGSLTKDLTALDLSMMVDVTTL